MTGCSGCGLLRANSTLLRYNLRTAKGTTLTYMIFKILILILITILQLTLISFYDSGTSRYIIFFPSANSLQFYKWGKWWERLSDLPREWSKKRGLERGNQVHLTLRSRLLLPLHSTDPPPSVWLTPGRLSGHGKGDTAPGKLPWSPRLLSSYPCIC